MKEEEEEDEKEKGEGKEKFQPAKKEGETGGWEVAFFFFAGGGEVPEACVTKAGTRQQRK